MPRYLLAAAVLGLAEPALAEMPRENFVEFFLGAEASAESCAEAGPSGDPPQGDGKGDVNADACACVITGPPCPGSCLTCETIQSFCDCTNGCSVGGCASGYTEVSATFCFGCLCYNETCRRFGPKTTGECASCASGRYGPLCNLCLGCNGHGTCRDGVTGDGLCNCNAGFNGPFCEYSDAVTCNGHGTAQYNGSCSCFPGFTGPSCNQCATNYYNYPTCRFCTAAASCSGHGSCDLTGFCQCTTGFAGSSCGTCATNYYSYPTCRFCTAASTCSSHGSCNATGLCDCGPGFAGSSCSSCATDYYGYPTCRFCTASGTCSGQGTCDATGSCVCDPDYTGSDCSACVSSVEMTCGDGEDNDCDLQPDCSDADCCGDASCVGPDADGDGVELCDCEDSNPDVWTLPGEVTDLEAAAAGGGGISLAWQAPADPGGVSVSYEVLRAWGAADFTAANPPCLQIGTLTSTADGYPVPIGGVLFYLVRAVNDCPGAGTLGRSSSNIERGGTCP